MHKSKMKHIWSLVCQKGIVDSQSNLLSIDSVFEQLTIGIPPNSSSRFNGKDILSVPRELEVVSFWRRIEGESSIDVEFLIKIMSPQKKEIASFPVKFEFPAKKRNFRTKVKMDVLPVVGPGEYHFVISQKENDRFKNVAEIPYDILLSEEGKKP